MLFILYFVSLLFLDLDQPTIQGNLNFIENEKVEVLWNCSTESYPAVMAYAWFKDGQPIPAETEYTFKKSQFIRSDAGIYSCQATNGILTNKSSNYPVTVSCKFSLFF